LQAHLEYHKLKIGDQIDFSNGGILLQGKLKAPHLADAKINSERPSGS
jgi:hypothetical protein